MYHYVFKYIVIFFGKFIMLFIPSKILKKEGCTSEEKENAALVVGWLGILGVVVLNVFVLPYLKLFVFS